MTTVTVTPALMVTVSPATGALSTDQVAVELQLPVVLATLAAPQTEVGAKINLEREMKPQIDADLRR